MRASPAGSGALDERSREVLRSLIRLHVATGEPVGSESLARAMHASVSPATLRNIMGDLERRGLLEHPHTSAGRMPTDEGYRVFVDSLMSARPLPPREAAAIDSELRAGEGSTRQVLETASHVLSKLSRNVGFVLGPDPGRTVCRQVDLVPLPARRVLVVLVSQAGLVSNRIVEVDEEIGREDLQACANYLNRHFAGMTLLAIRARLLQLMKEEKALYDSLLKRVVTLGEKAFSPAGEPGEVYLDGTANILDLPGFEDVRRMRGLFQAFEEKSRLVRILNACLGDGGVRIIIGHENPDPDLHSLAVVSAVCPLEGATGLGLGVMGSTRMEYARTIGIVDHVARAVSQALEELRA